MVVLVVGINAGSAFAADLIYVDDDANGLNNGSSWDDAYTAFDVALGNAVSPDYIWVAAGIYQSDDSPASFNLVDGVDVYGGFAGDEDPNFDLSDRNFSANKTELSGERLSGGNNTAVVWANSLGNAGVLDGFTINAASHGVFCSSSDQTVKNCVILDNTQKGIFCNNSDVVIEDCTIIDNTEDGIYANTTSNIHVSGCIISDNGEHGLELSVASTIANSIICRNILGGLTAPGQGIVITNDLIYDNIGNGVHFTSPDDTDILRNNTIVYNSGVGIKNNNIGGYSPAISNCIVWGNTVAQTQGNCLAIFSCIQGISSGSGNIAEDPNFVLSDPNDFHLSVDSPCIAAGVTDPNTYEDGELDMDGQARVYNGRIDIGADEYRVIGDLDNDGFVNYVDFGIFSIAWDSQVGEPVYNSEYDLDGNGFINLDDLLALVNRWL